MLSGAAVVWATEAGAGSATGYLVVVTAGAVAFTGASVLVTSVTTVVSVFVWVVSNSAFKVPTTSSSGVISLGVSLEIPDRTAAMSVTGIAVSVAAG